MIATIPMKSCANFNYLLLAWLFSISLKAQIKGDVPTLHAVKFRWMIERNLDSLAMLLHPKLQYIHSNGWIESRDEVLENIRSGKLIYRQVEIQSISVREKGMKAIVKGRGTFHVTLDGKDISIPLSYEEHYKKSRKGWQLIFRKSQRIVTQ
ncbi:MAG: nuclear transport factor 2 family protein [Thermaurantimonas sp.]|uniref:nuclear transport factor 2 family protein n=1 Tax=Thermaurantimonas sp. TaxID=2681568 RepID=UPI00391BE0C8